MTDTGYGDDFDPDDSLALAEPDRVYGRLRSDCPVARSSAYGGFWAVTRYADVQRVMTDTAAFTSSRGIIIPRNPASGRRPPLHYDPPEHTTYRAAINPVFRKDRLRRLDPIVTGLAGELLPPVGTGVPVELYGGYCSPFAGRVVCALLNIPDDLVDDFVTHSEIFEDAQRRRLLATIEAENQFLYARCREVVERRRREALPPEEDLVSALLSTRVGGELLDPEVVVGSLRQIIVAGHGAPALVLASAVWHLAVDERLQAELRAHPETTTGLVEEMLRLHTPNVGFARTAVRDVELGDRLIREGEPVAVVLPAANRDPAVFDEPGDVRVGRKERHLAFGYGPHVCPGSVTGRQEVALAIRALLSRTDRVTLAGDVAWSPWPTSGPVHLPLILEGRTR